MPYASIDVCAYCQTRRATICHPAIPQAMFRRPRPHPIPVACCEKCHESLRFREQYFSRVILATGEQLPEYAQVRDLFRKHLKRSQRASTLTRVVKSVLTPERALAGKRTDAVNPLRMKQAVRQMIVGLHFHKFRTGISDGNEITVRSIAEAKPFHRPTMVGHVEQIITTGGTMALGDDVRIAQSHCAQLPGVSLWAIQFMNRDVYLAYVGPKQPTARPLPESNLATCN